MMAKHVLAVDDDATMRAMVADYLRDRGFRATGAADGQTMRSALAQGDVDLVILDLKLAGEEGLDLLRELRTHSGVPVIVVTGQRRDEVDRVVGLEVGADDYLTKPFGMRELVARIHAVLRRAEAADPHPEGGNKRVRYCFGGWELNYRTHQLRAPDGTPVSLTRGEFGLLVAFLRSPEQVLNREQLLAASRVHDDEVYDRSIDVQILRLRRKLEADPSDPALIKTERGAGYILAAPVEIR